MFVKICLAEELPQRKFKSWEHGYHYEIQWDRFPGEQWTMLLANGFDS